VSEGARDRLLVAGLELEWRELAPAADGRPLGLWVLCDPDVLLDQITEAEYYAFDERMPYFGAIWPSAESLVARLQSGPALDGVEVLDLGCGLGACGFAAATRGAQVTFVDWEPRALEIAEQSALHQPAPLSRFDFVVADWRKPPKLRPFDLILGADVLYEDRNAPAVATFLVNHLKPGAEAWITDPNRPHARRFPALAQQAGLEFVGGEILPAMAHKIDVTLLRLRRPK
jgi:2-polyprenyl-3-methyl-5-hydroxy-6-metoxy-1,4-benzoquinol methylase